MSTPPFLVHVCSAPNGDAEQHPEPLPPHRIVRSCVELHGYPRCYGAAHDGAAACNCDDTLTAEQHAQCRADAWDAFNARGGEACDDCAFRKGSPEAEQLEQIASSPVPFRCHKGMPVDARRGFPVLNAYCPGVVASRERGVEAPDYPVCAGWKRAHAAVTRR